MNTPDLSKLDYPGELTSEALSVLDTYSKWCCNTSATARKLNKGYIQVRRFLKQPYVRELFQLQLMRKGVTPEKIAETIRGGIEAFDKEGNPDWITRQRFTQLACEIYEVLKYTTKVDAMVMVEDKEKVKLEMLARFSIE